MEAEYPKWVERPEGGRLIVESAAEEAAVMEGRVIYETVKRYQADPFLLIKEVTPPVKVASTKKASSSKKEKP